MKIAITSQNRREITEHAGRCRKFWIYDIEENKIRNKSLLELPKEKSFHESSPAESHPLDDVTVLISASMGQGIKRRLAAKGILAIVTTERNPDDAVSAYLSGRLQILAPEEDCHHGHHHHHG